MKKKSTKIPIILFLISLSLFSIIFYRYYEITPWPVYVLAFLLVCMCGLSFDTAARIKRRPKILQTDVKYRYYGKTDNGNFILSIVHEKPALNRFNIQDPTPSVDSPIFDSKTSEEDFICEPYIEDIRGKKTEVILCSSVKFKGLCYIKRLNGSSKKEVYLEAC